MGVQMFAIASPPQATASQSANDIIKGGFRTKSEVISICRQGDNARTPDFATILVNYDINCGDLERATVQKVKSTGSFTGGKLYSMGRLPYGPTGKKGQPSNEQQVTVPGARTTLYMRLLSRWDSGASSEYSMLVGTNNFGVKFAIMFDCGNLVMENPQPTMKPPVVPPVVPPVTPPPPKPPVVPRCPLDQSLPVNDERCKQCPYNPDILVGNPSCKVCDKSATSDDAAACLVLSKTARNETKGITNANNTTAKPNDIIIYTLSTKNTSKVTIKNFVVEENVNDILDYAIVVNAYGGNLTDDGIIRWPAVDIPAGSTLTKMLAVKVKSPLPQTPTSTSNPGTYDLVMTNVYGNVVNIKVEGDIVKTVQVVTKELPNTGPGTSIAIGFGLTTVVAYFLARSRLLGKELEIIKEEQMAGGV
jgi:uncharacterized repeat protein (TIGR01451 family)